MRSCRRLVFTVAAMFTITLGLFAATKIPTWTLLSPSGLTFPLFRGGNTTVYDPVSNEIIVFSGFSADQAIGSHLNDVWALTNANGLGSGGSWSNLIANGAAGSPGGRHNHSAVYDSTHNRMIIFGGCLGGCFPLASDLWVLSNANGVGGPATWTELFPTGGPPPARQGHQAVYDPATNSMIVWSGQNGGGSACATFSDVWVLSNANGLGGTPNWTQLSPTGGPPAGQYFPTAVYDSTNNVMTVFGGIGFVGSTCTVTNAVWTLSHANGTGGTPAWTNLVVQDAPGSPSSREAQLAVYSPAGNRMIIFGGYSSTVLGDTWSLAHANGIGGTPTWTKLSPSGTLKPLARAPWNGGGFDITNHRMIMFGGGFAEGPLWSTWVLSHADGL